MASLVAALLTACSVKLLDDLLDSGPDDDLYARRAVYCALALCLACLARVATAAPLFLACYAAGMVFKPEAGMMFRYETGSRATFARFMEPAAAILVLVACCGPVTGAAALLLASFAQLADDVLDFTADLGARPANLAHRFGVVECALAGTSCLLTAGCLEPRLAASALAGAVAVWAIEWALARREEGGTGD